MSIKQPDILEHNNPNLPIADQKNVKGGYFTVNTIAERNAIPIAKRGNMLVNVLDVGLYKYMKKNDFSNTEWEKGENWDKTTAKYIAVTVSRNFTNNDSGKCLILESSNVVLNLVDGLDHDFNCTVKATSGNNGSITKDVGIVTDAPNGLIVAENKMISIGRLIYSNVDKYIITP